MPDDTWPMVGRWEGSGIAGLFNDELSASGQIV